MRFTPETPIQDFALAERPALEAQFREGIQERIKKAESAEPPV
jgi:hypothetical protein